MGAGGIPNRSVEIVNGRFGDLPTVSVKPNSRMDLYVNGIRVQSRWYDSECRVVRNRDYIHQNPHRNHFFPHDHVWEWVCDCPIRGVTFIEPDYDNYGDT